MKLKLTDRILKTADGKRDLGEIAVELNTTERYIRSFLCRIRRYDLIPPEPDHVVVRANPWKIDGLEERMLELVKEGISYNQVAVVLNNQFGTGLSRNAVLGRVHRLGKAGEVVARIKSSNNYPRKPMPKPKEHTAPKAERITKTKVFAPEPYLVRTDLPPAVARITLQELKEHSCRWPVGEPDRPFPEFGFCGQDRVPGRPYCPDCCRRAYSPAPVRTRSPEKVQEDA